MVSMMPAGCSGPSWLAVLAGSPRMRLRFVPGLRAISSARLQVAIREAQPLLRGPCNRAMHRSRDARSHAPNMTQFYQNPRPDAKIGAHGDVRTVASACRIGVRMPLNSVGAARRTDPSTPLGMTKEQATYEYGDPSRKATHQTRSA